MAISTEGDEILERIIPLLASFDLVVDLGILQRAAHLTPPAVPLQHPRFKEEIVISSKSLPNLCP